MNKEQVKIFHISHDDLDGVGALQLTKLAFSPEQILGTKPTPIKNIDKDVEKFVRTKWEKDTLFIISDLSVNEEVAKLIDKKVQEGYQVQLIDHHPTALWLMETYDWATVIPENGQKTCATQLYLNYLVEKGYLTPSSIIKDYVELVRSYDVWDWYPDNLRAKELNDLLYIIGRNSFDEFVLARLQNDSLKEETFSFGEKEVYLLEVEQTRIEKYIKQKEKELTKVHHTIDGRDYLVGVIAIENYHSETGNDLCRKEEDMDFIAMVDVGKQKISFRTIKEDVNVSLIAKFFGGGGHPKSSGCTLYEETISLFLNPIVYRKEETE